MPTTSTEEGLLNLIHHTELQPFLEASLRHCVESTGAAAGSLLFGGAPPLRLRHGMLCPEAAEQVDRWERGVQSRLSTTTRWRQSAQTQPAFTTRSLGEGLPTLFSAPIIANETLVGALSLQLAADRPLPAEIAAGLGSHLSLIGDRARLLHSLQTAEQRLTQMELFLKVGQSMVATFDLGRLLDDTTELATAIVNAAAASLMLIDTDTNELVFEYAIGEKRDEIRQKRIGINEGIAGWVATHGHPVIVNDVKNDPRWLKRVDAATGFLTESIAAVPLEIRGRVIGVLEALNKVDGYGFDEEDLTMLHSIAAQAAIAIDNARLYQSLRDERDKIIKAQEDVRRELARNLHDGTVQLLAAISMGIDHVERLLKLKPDAVYAELDALRQLTRQATRETRLLLFELRPVILETQGLVAALHSYVEHLQSSENYDVQLEVADFGQRLRRHMEGTVFSIIQEALNNVKRHAKAQHVWLRLAALQGELVVTVRDDGQGFDLASVERDYDKRGSFGLLNMRERAMLIDGKVAIESKTSGPDRGTVVTLRAPLPGQT
ncbi:MAG: GAF domain-containing sensor histidine kinase [Chloroflexi bacterium]|nr:GAF domain-containing sensor histidine kinase [Chloroflexota bacterium]